MRRLFLLLLFVFAAGQAAAAPSCRVPANLPAAQVEPVPPDEIVKGVEVAYYLLAISWTPDRRQADAARRPYAFSLHGLWPNGKAPPYPRYCRPVDEIPAATVREMYCRTPSVSLLQHEWQAHGACGWGQPADYFRQAAVLYDRVRLPRIETLRRPTAGAVRAAITAQNRWLPRDAIFVSEKDGRLAEVRLCYDLAYRPAACPGGVGAPDNQTLVIPQRAARRT